MLDGTYVGVLKMPMGDIRGKVSLVTNGSGVSGILEVMGNKNAFSGGIAQGDSFKFEGNIKSILGNFTYRVTGKVTNDILEADVHTKQGNFKIEGTRQI